jgi:hypothetical protein
MPKEGHTEEQLVAVVRQVEAGAQGAVPIARRHQPGDILSVEAAVFQCRGERAAAVARGKRTAQAVGGRPKDGSAGPAGDRLKKDLRPRVRHEPAAGRKRSTALASGAHGRSIPTRNSTPAN